MKPVFSIRKHRTIPRITPRERLGLWFIIDF